MPTLLAPSRKRVFALWVSGVVVVAFFSGCATKKKASTTDMSPWKRKYENITAYYNAYFNANEIYQIVLDKLRQEHRENYQDLLPIYPMDAADVRPHVEELDRAISKLYKTINRHPQSHWADDAYFMIGKIQVLKKDYETAEETMEYFRQAFDPLKVGKTQKVKNSKKKRSKAKKRRRKKRQKDKTAYVITQPKKSYMPWEHQPVYDDGLLLLGRIYTYRGKYAAARQILRRLKESPKTKLSDPAQLDLALAHLALTEHKYDDAISHLEQAVKKLKSKGQRARYYYIMGQLHEHLQQWSGAAKAFAQAEKYAKDFDLQLHAQLHQYIAEVKDGKPSSYIVRKLKKLLDEEKYTEYRGDIYYTMGLVALETQDAQSAHSYFSMALKEATSPHLKKRIYLYLVQHYMDQSRYDRAKLYLDSALYLMHNRETDFEKWTRVRESIAQIAAQLQTIHFNDSILRISYMDDKEKLRLAKKIQAREYQRQQKKNAQLQQSMQDLAQTNASSFPPILDRPSRFVPTSVAGTSFFAYDPSKVKRGRRKFEKLWGRRPLEDHWRRIQKSYTLEITEDTLSVKNDQEVEDLPANRDLIRKYLSGIPTTEAQRQKVRERIQKAYFELGRLYRQQLERCDLSVAALDTLLHRFPNTPYRAGAYYYLSLCHADLGNTAEAERYRQHLLDEFPDSLYAKVLSDPDFVRRWLEEKNRACYLYDQAYRAFQRGQFDKTLQLYDTFQQLKEKERAPYEAKFALLKAMATGSKGKDAYIEALKDVIARYPNTPQAIRAREIKRFLEGEAEQTESTEADPASPYRYLPEQVHYVLLVFRQLGGNSMRQIQVDISEFHRKNFPKRNLKMSSANLDIERDIPILLIRRFDNASDAMDYYKIVQRQKKKYIRKQGVEYDIFPIARDNYHRLIREKNTDSYLRFFKKYYKDGERSP